MIEDLIKQTVLNKIDWGIVHYNSYDARGIDVGLIYQKKRFTVTDSYKRELVIFDEYGKREYTRDILVVKGLLDGEKIAIFMNHWPSRRGGEAASQAKRNFAANALREEMDKIKNEISNFYKRSSYGCENCNNSGVKGIVVLMEYLFRPPIDSIIQFNKKVFKEKYLKQSFYDDVLRYVKNGEICESYLQKSFVLNE